MTVPVHDRPIAAKGLTSYRYKSRHGYVMIGALDHSDAMHQAARSLSCLDPLQSEKLQVWNGEKYVASSPEAA